MYSFIKLILMRLNKKKISGKIIFIIGLPGSGKTTIARKIKSILNYNQISNLHLDGDDIRNTLNNKKYSLKNRIYLSKFYLKLSDLFLKQTQVVILSSVSLYKEIEEIYKKKKNIKAFLIKKKFGNIDKNKKIIRSNYKKKIKYHSPSKKVIIINNKSVLKSSREILNNFR